MSEDKPKTNGARNKRAGSLLETQIVKQFKEIGFKYCATSRACNKVRDGEKVDLCNIDESKYGRLPYNIQAKTLSKPAPYGKILDEMPKGEQINVLIHKQTKKDKAGRFQHRGTYAIMSIDDFYDIIKRNLELEDEVKAWSNIM